MRSTIFAAPVNLTTLNTEPRSHIKGPEARAARSQPDNGRNAENIRIAGLLSGIQKITLQTGRLPPGSREVFQGSLSVLTSLLPEDRKGKKRARDEMELLEEIAMAVISSASRHKKRQERGDGRSDERPTKRLNAFGGDGVASTSRISG